MKLFTQVKSLFSAYIARGFSGQKPKKMYMKEFIRVKGLMNAVNVSKNSLIKVRNSDMKKDMKEFIQVKGLTNAVNVSKNSLIKVRNSDMKKPTQMNSTTSVDFAQRSFLVLTLKMFMKGFILVKSRLSVKLVAKNLDQALINVIIKRNVPRMQKTESS